MYLFPHSTIHTFHKHINTRVILKWLFKKLPTNFGQHTDGSRILHTLLVKHYNDLLDRQSSERSRDEVTQLYVGEVFCIHLGSKYADFQEKIFADISGRKFETLYCSNVTTIGILRLRAKVYTKDVPNIELCNFIPAPLRTLSIKQVIVVLY